jgi:hypothetical protein
MATKRSLGNKYEETGNITSKCSPRHRHSAASPRYEDRYHAESLFRTWNGSPRFFSWPARSEPQITIDNKHFNKNLDLITLPATPSVPWRACNAVLQAVQV